MLCRYGTTETGGLSSNGQIVAGARVRLLDSPALGYTTADTPFPRGEVLASTGRMAGYFHAGRLREDGTMAPAVA
jgi:hypothetical protein